MDVCALVGLNLRRLRTAKAWSQEVVGARAKLEPTYVSRVERGQENVTVQTLDKLAAVLEVHVSELLAPADSERATPTTLKPGPKAKGG